MSGRHGPTACQVDMDPLSGRHGPTVQVDMDPLSGRHGPTACQVDMDPLSGRHGPTLSYVCVYIFCFCSEVEVLSADAAAASLSPISGYITYSADEAMTSLSLTSIDDDVPEPSAQFVLSLTNIEGGARVSASQDSAIVTVLKSDSSNGIFGFTSDSSANVIDEPGSIVLSVNRSEGTFDDVSVTWEVREAMTGTAATQDFAPATGRVEFVDGQDLASFVVMALDETVPELEEDFLVVLTSAITSDNQTSSTGLSGASIAAEQSQSTLTVTENDFPYGVIQFSPSAPSPGQTIITATLMPEVTVLESDGTVTVYVVRAQGTLGSVSAEFFTSDGTALNMGLSPDYTSNAGLLTFADGVTVQSFDVVLIDDSDPELEKTFFVNLTNPQGGKETYSYHVHVHVRITCTYVCMYVCRCST